MREVIRSIYLFSIFLAVMSISGCATSRMYSGDPLPSDHVAFLERGDLAQILISVDQHQSINFFLLYKEIEILPGEHTIVVTYGDGSKKGFAYPLTFTAKAGVRYVVKSSFVDMRWQPSIVEKKSGITASDYPIYFIPMYGSPEIKKTESQKRADEQFIRTVVAESGSREKSAKEFAVWAWALKRKGLVENAIRRFNQSWLLDKGYYQPYWGFGAITLANNEPAKAAVYFEKALDLIDDGSEKPRLQVDAARAYALQGMESKMTNTVKSDGFYRKANLLIKEALTTDPKYGTAYRIGALIYYEQGNYKGAWKVIKKARVSGNYKFAPKFIEKLSKEMAEP